MPTCKNCKTPGPSDQWGRYPNGRLHVLCPACDGIEAQRQAEIAEAKARGYAGRGNTPEYKRQQREREAAKSGQELGVYVSQAERGRLARMARVERVADRTRSRWAVEWLRPFRDDAALYAMDYQFRERKKAAWRATYSRNREREVARVGKYKRKHSDRNLEWTRTRLAREAELADGTVTREQIVELKSRATHCAYCDAPLHVDRDVQTDHMIALCHGGAHSLRNIVIVCARCNGRKARLTFAEWVERIGPEHRDRVVALYETRYGLLAAA